ncbi:MAG: BatA domain-containing protein [Candidatus Brocadiia bacterium]
MPQFINPYMLFGLLGVAVPILIHLLNRYRHKEIDWAAMELLRRALVVRARRIRIEDILILLLRCLAVALLALAMARPTLKASAGSLLGDEEVGVVVAVDASYSMGHRPGVSSGPSRFDRALETLRRITKTLDPGDPVTLVFLGSRKPQPALANVGYDAQRVDRLLAKAEPLAEGLNVDVCLDELDTLVREIKAPVRECYIISDAQSSAWGDLSDEAKTALERIAQRANLFFLPTGSAGTENLAVTRFALAPLMVRQGAMARCKAEVRNFGRQPRANVPVSLYIGESGNPVDQRTIPKIEPGEARSILLSSPFRTTGDVRLRAGLEPDPLGIDNSRHAVAHVRERIRVLLVDGEPSDRPDACETHFIRSALAPRRTDPRRAPLQVRTIPWVALRTERLANYHVVVLANVPGVRETEARALYEFVQQGGGLFVFLGPKTIPGAFDTRMEYDGTALLPLELESLADRRQDGRSWAFEALLSDHPLASPLVGMPREPIISQYVQGSLRPGARAILQLAGTDDPLLASHGLGRGKVLLFTSTADRAWGDFIYYPPGPILLHHAVTFLTRRSHERAMEVGEPLDIPLPREGLQEEVTFRDPAGHTATVTVTRQNGERKVRFARTTLPGFYQVDLGPGAAPLVTAVNVDPSESDVACLGGEELVEALRIEGPPVRIVRAGDELAAAIRQSRRGHELWRALLVAALVVLVAEALLAHLFSRRAVTRRVETQRPRGAELLASSEPTSGD